MSDQAQPSQDLPVRPAPAMADNTAAAAAAPKQPKEKKQKSEKQGAPQGGKPAEKPLPDFIIERNKLFDELKKQREEELANKEHLQITISVDAGDGKGAQQCIGKAFETTPGSFLKDVPKDIASRIVIAKVDKQLWDLDRPLEKDAHVEFLPFESEEGRQVFWHSSAHALGEACECEFGCMLSHGPPTAQGYFYDMALPEGTVVKESDWPALDKRSDRVCKEKQKFERLEVSKENLKK
ncbi:threonyl-tRNA synthetase, partial [Ascosphaera atra]